MRAVTLLDLARVEDPIVRAALDEVQKASQDNVINDVKESGAALATITGAGADEIAYYTGPTDVALTAFTAFARTLVAAADATAALTVLGLPTTSIGQYFRNVDVYPNSELATADCNAVLLNGFYNISNPVNGPPTADIWIHLIVQRHHNLGNYFLLQIATELVLATHKTFIRACNNGVWTAWDQVITTGSGLALLAANNLSDVNAATARSNLGLVIGTNVLAYDPQLTSNVRGNVFANGYSTVLTDGEKYLTPAGGNYSVTINDAVGYPDGTCITFFNWTGTPLTIAISGATLVQAGTVATGSRTLSGSWGLATAMKVSSVGAYWIISGTGLT